MSAIQTFRHYRISQDPAGGAVEVWRSGSEVVCVAVDTLRQVLVELHVGIADPTQARELKPFIQIATQAGQIRHRHFLSILDSGEDEGANYYVTEFVDGERLDSYLARCNPLPPWLALEILAQLTDGMVPLAQQPALLAALDVFNSTIQQMGETPEDILCKIADLALTAQPKPADLVLSTATQRLIVDSARLLFYMLTGNMPQAAPTAADLSHLVPEVNFLLTAIGTPGHPHHPSSLEQLRNLVERCQRDLTSESGGARPDKLSLSLRPRLPLQSHYLSPTTVSELVSGDFTLDPKPFDAASPYRHAAITRSTRIPVTIQLLPPDRLMPRDYARSLRTAVQRINGLDHPNLLRVVAFPDAEQPELYIEEATGKYHLASVLKMKGGFDAQECTLILEQLLEAHRQAEGCGLTPVIRSLSQIYLHFTDPLGESQLPSEAELSRLPLGQWPAFRLRMRTYPTALNLCQPERFLLERLLPPGHPGADTVPTQKSSSLLTPFSTRDMALLTAIFTAGRAELSEKLRHHIFDHLRTRKGSHQPTPKDFVDRLAAMSGRTLVTKTTPKKSAKKKVVDQDELALPFDDSAPGFLSGPREPNLLEDTPGSLALGRDSSGYAPSTSTAPGFAEMLFGGQLAAEPDEGPGVHPSTIFQAGPLEPPVAGERNFLDGPLGQQYEEAENYNFPTEPAKKRNNGIMLILLVILVAALVAGVMAHFTGRAFWLTK
jgi:hypothetical protein